MVSFDNDACRQRLRGNEIYPWDLDRFWEIWWTCCRQNGRLRHLKMKVHVGPMGGANATSNIASACK